MALVSVGHARTRLPAAKGYGKGEREEIRDLNYQGSTSSSVVDTRTHAVFVLHKPPHCTAGS